ncbi:hypothetical protein [Brazilian marseillevirus]|nr:hypothetical protein A3303_gp028 [Brazilian marseillevirus]AMQ10536.1 hypothetical protein [Brazilian marseillevirus]
MKDTKLVRKFFEDDSEDFATFPDAYNYTAFFSER